MNAINKTLKKYGIFALITILINIALLLVDIFVYKFSIFSIVLDSISVVLTLFTGVMYLCYSKQSANKIAQSKNLFLVVSLVNILNNLIIWFMSFHIYILVNALNSKMVIQKGIQPSLFQTECEDEIIIDIEEYDAKTRSDILVERLEKIKSLKANNLITDQEYQKLREESLKEFIR